MLDFPLALLLSFMHLIHNILAPVKTQVRHLRSLYNLPPKSSLQKALHQQRVVPLSDISSIPRIHKHLIRLCEIERNVDIVGKVDLEHKV